MRTIAGTIEVNDDQIERAIRDLRKWTELSGLNKELRMRAGYLSRTQRKKIKAKIAAKRMKRRIAREAEHLRRKDRRGVKR